MKAPPKAKTERKSDTRQRALLRAPPRPSIAAPHAASAPHHHPPASAPAVSAPPALLPAWLSSSAARALRSSSRLHHGWNCSSPSPSSKSKCERVQLSSVTSVTINYLPFSSSGLSLVGGCSFRMSLSTEFQDALGALEVPYRKILLARRNGSYGHNTAVAGKSDVDMYIVYAASTEMVLVDPLEAKSSRLFKDGAHKIRLPVAIPTGEGTGESRVEEVGVDVHVYEVGKFFELLVQGSPLAVEAVFGAALAAEREGYGDEVVVDGEMERVVEMRNAFLTRQAFRSLLGHAESELRQIQVAEAMGNPYAKLLYHFARVMMEVEAVYAGNPLVVAWETGSENHTTLMAVKSMAMPGSDRQDLLRVLSQRHGELKVSDPYPESLPPPLEFSFPPLNQILFDIRSANWVVPPMAKASAASVKAERSEDL